MASVCTQVRMFVAAIVVALDALKRKIIVISISCFSHK